MPAMRLEDFQSDAGQAYLDFESRAAQNNLLGIDPFIDYIRSSNPTYDPILGFVGDR